MPRSAGGSSTGPSRGSTTRRAGTSARWPKRRSVASRRCFPATAGTAASARWRAIATTVRSPPRWPVPSSARWPRAELPCPSRTSSLRSQPLPALALEMGAAPAHRRGVDAREATVAELVVAVQGGNRAAFGSLYERFHRVVHAVALARVPACDAGDVVQDVFADVWIKVTRLREPAAFPGWILTMARNRATDVARRRRPIDL